MNNYYFKLPITNLSIQLPVEIQWDFLDRSNAIEKFEREVVSTILGSPEDFEITRFAHDTFNPNSTQTDINYEFYFYNTGTTNCSA